jgi:hypothetical protein
MKYKGFLRCEACNRWTDVGMGHLPVEKWAEIVEKEQVFFCKRENCVSRRA